MGSDSRSQSLPEPIRGCEEVWYNPKTKRFISVIRIRLWLFRNYLTVWSSSDFGDERFTRGTARQVLPIILMPGNDELGIFYDRNNTR